MGVMKKKWETILLCLGFLSLYLFPGSNLHASESLNDGLMWLTKEEIHEKFGKPNFLYCEEEPYRRYEIVAPEQEKALRATFLYDVVIHELYQKTKDGKNFEYRFYYAEDSSGGKKVYRLKEYSIKFLNAPVQMGKIAELIPEFKPAHECPKVYQERLLNYNTIRLIFVTEKVSDLSKRIGSLFVDRDKDINDWSLSYKVLLCSGEPENVSVNSMVKEIIVTVDGEYRIGKTAHAFGTKLVKNPLQ